MTTTDKPEQNPVRGVGAEEHVMRRQEADARGCWYCLACDTFVPPENVTYEETHDPRYGGCGNSVDQP
jgi:hypothetical protein